MICKRHRCTAPIVERRLCAFHLGLERQQEKVRQAKVRSKREEAEHRSLFLGPLPVVLLPGTFVPPPDFEENMEFLFEFIANGRYDKESIVPTASTLNVKKLPYGKDKINGRWREMRTNFLMGMNLKLAKRDEGVRLVCASRTPCIVFMLH